MLNAAYTSEYAEYRKKFNYIFNDKYLRDIEIKNLSSDFSVKIYSYFDKYTDEHNYDHTVHCSFFQLIDNDNNIIYSNKNINDEAEFFDLIEHQNEIKYLIFRIDLYGYSILDLSTMKDYHFIPMESFKGNETFIWVSLHYNKCTNLLAVEGCFWAYPYSVFITDFSNPINVPFPECDIKQYLINNEYDNIDFNKWDENNNLVVEVEHEDGIISEHKTVTVDKEICFTLLINAHDDVK